MIDCGQAHQQRGIIGFQGQGVTEQLVRGLNITRAQGDLPQAGQGAHGAGGMFQRLGEQLFGCAVAPVHQMRFSGAK